MVTMSFDSPLGPVMIAGDDSGLAGLWLEGQKYFADTLPQGAVAGTARALERTRSWLEEYFAGKRPDWLPPLAPAGTQFRQEIWKLLLEIPYGKTTTYGGLCAAYTERTGKKTSARAVGGAVGHNPISIIIPCHRVIGSDGSLTGYAGGVDKKAFLLRHEGILTA
ncbi:MAG: methylated-DNA--[protein]-cysteine S-methyltransferase [Clostridiales bacterium]|jgi:methylated-DNA-[protein]-cysteine S-methyltransferase|nr:methylated-DNA--[protein]-cysteine S-methyltransferase [Clostridiales bacterium]